MVKEALRESMTLVKLWFNSFQASSKMKTSLFLDSASFGNLFIAWLSHFSNCSLFTRYYLLYSADSHVRLEKVSFDQRTIAMGLKAQQPIHAGTAILSTCSSMSLDTIHDGKPSISVIEASRGQLGPSGPRLILGPLRFANHDCNPNCQVQFHKTSRLVSWSWLVRCHQRITRICVVGNQGHRGRWIDYCQVHCRHIVFHWRVLLWYVQPAAATSCKQKDNGHCSWARQCRRDREEKKDTKRRKARTVEEERGSAWRNAMIFFIILFICTQSSC